jgi:superfamily II RNA helicase
LFFNFFKTNFTANHFAELIKQKMGKKGEKEEDLFSVFDGTTKKRKFVAPVESNPEEQDSKKIKISEKSKETKTEETTTMEIPQESKKEEVKVSAPFMVSRDFCHHEVALPPNYSGEDPLKQKIPEFKPAKEYPYTLDAFQRESIEALECKQSVLVSAHTSAGKTTGSNSFF